MDTGPLTGNCSSGQRLHHAEPQLVVVLERTRPLAGGARHSLANIDRVIIGRGDLRAARRLVTDGARTLALTLPDPRMSATHATIDRQGDTWTFVDRGSTNGSRIGRARVSVAKLEDGDLLELAGTFLRYRSAVRSPVTAPGDVTSAELTGLPAIVGTLLPWFSDELEQLGRVARSRLSILLRGESGTGKEVLARAIHAQSRSGGPFVAVNCGALPESLVESILFGHKKGAFSGAVSEELGLVRAAHGGTLFLDEVGDLPKASQAALLRVLQEGEVLPIGATRTTSVDARVVAATHRSLELLVASGDFRGDLFARLAAFPFTLPPLRERADDIGVLLAALLPRIRGNRASSLAIGANAAHALLSYAWPNNVRELEHCISVCAVLAVGDRIDDLCLRDPPWAGAAPDPPQQARSSRDEALRAQIVASLQQQRGNVTRVGELMGKRRTQVQRLLRRLKIDPRVFRE